jgi:tRNA A37 N6-isopentenylltransferase MiaA
MNNSGIDKEKAKIIHQADLHKVELEEEITQLTEKAERAITTALIVGGTLALTYFIVKGFSGKSSKKKKWSVGSESSLRHCDSLKNNDSTSCMSFFVQVLPKVSAKVLVPNSCNSFTSSGDPRRIISQMYKLVCALRCVLLF